MNVFDSLNNKKWNGKGLHVINESISMKANSNAYHNIIIFKGSYNFRILGKKRSGNGKFNVNY